MHNPHRKPWPKSKTSDIYKQMKVKNDHRSKFSKKRSLKKIRASKGFEPVTSALPVRCSTNQAMKPHIGSEVNLLSSYLLSSTTAVQNELFHIQLFRERLSGEVHATILKGIVGGFEFSFFQRNLKELARKALEMCLRVLKESNKSRFDSYSRQEQCIDHIPYYLSGLSRAHFFRQPSSK